MGSKNDLVKIFDELFNKGYLKWIAVGLGIMGVWILSKVYL